MKTVSVTLEALPSPPPSPDVILNSPALSKGSFVIGWAKPFSPTDFEKLRSEIWKFTENDLEEFDMFFSEPGWRITLAGLQKARALGYEIMVNGISLPDVSLAGIHAILQKKEEERKRVEEERRKKEEAKQNERTKIEEWRKGLAPLRFDPEGMHYEIIEEYYYWRNISGSKFDERIRFTAPSELAGVEGVHVADHDYDTHYDTYFVPLAIADKLNAAFYEKAWKREQTRLLTSPSSYDMQSVLFHEFREKGFANFTDCAGHCPQEEEFLSSADNRKRVIEAFKSSFLAHQRAGEDHDYWYNSLDTICEAIGIKSEVEAIWQERKNIEVKRKADEAAKRKTDEAAEKARFKSLVEKHTKSIEGLTKPQLIEKYGRFVRRKSAKKNEIVNDIAYSLATEELRQ